MPLNKKNITPSEIFAEHKTGTEFKAGIGDKGISEQGKINERFYVGDQWYGAKCGNRPLVRRNLIKRIGEYKIAMIASSPIAVNYSAEGIPNTVDIQKGAEEARDNMLTGQENDNIDTAIKTNMVMGALSNYFNVTAERVKFEDKKNAALKNAYVSGTGIVYTYWDSGIKTGLYADEEKNVAINGDIQLEVLDVENVVFGDPNNDDVQSQPFISFAQRLVCDDVRRYAKANGIGEDELQQIKPDGNSGEYYAGERGEQEPTDSRRVTVITKFYKEYDKNGNAQIIAVKVTENAFVRRPWNTQLTLYPFAKMSWETRKSSIYGDSEITYLIPNQIAVNRALSAEVWAMMMSGLPVTLVNGDMVEEPISNTPGEIIKVYGSGEGGIANAVKHIPPPVFASQYQNMISAVANDTLNDSGATSAALGEMKMDNASAIMQLREAAAMPMQPYKNRFYSFCEDIARIWADFWVNLYGNRKIKIRDSKGEWYMPFNAEAYKDYVITARIDVGAATLWSEAVVVSALDSLLQGKLINFIQYLKRLPEGYIPDKTGLIKEVEAAEKQSAVGDDQIIEQLKQTNQQAYAELMAMSPEEQAQAIQMMRQGGKQ